MSTDGQTSIGSFNTSMNTKTEVTFNKQQRKTFPSLMVFARPTLKIKEANINDRPALDVKMNSVFTQSAAKCTEWLIQQGLIRSEQTCRIHPRAPLKLGKFFFVYQQE